mmetsp:Transcript_43870/g.49772  ORF Transcript_43870/g.49772 Transcript_43870/m.49772 type:complete len:100 (-) Transcript_43870:241-540(-)|eukprot:CAMPEP_0194146280 /NCGR_PEP_ID=MMETSP0152-20130528/20497_1 /TAXON_ID=1049557 /ORGANISM="Thalassiothrix antarctica, Strain L6-D1" /LENGTH=99 /DNA_ID=CAMNT_0038846763 /DNA_START=51 /DNA_END=350 /DNA_ORIENTATION=+
MKLATVFTLFSSFFGVAAIKPDLFKTSSRATDTKRNLRSHGEKFEDLQDILNKIENIEDELNSTEPGRGPHLKVPEPEHLGWWELQLAHPPRSTSRGGV